MLNKNNFNNKSFGFYSRAKHSSFPLVFHSSLRLTPRTRKSVEVTSQTDLRIVINKKVKHKLLKN